ncbi:unnamed protein product, partial [Amoebophrya sp. A120]|eukprot:GSA120T00001487001.1
MATTASSSRSQLVFDSHVHLRWDGLSYSWMRHFQHPDQHKNPPKGAMPMRMPPSRAAATEGTKGARTGGSRDLAEWQAAALSTTTSSSSAPGSKLIYRVFGGLFIETGVDADQGVREAACALAETSNPREELLAELLDAHRTTSPTSSNPAFLPPRLLGVCASIPCHCGAHAVQRFFKDLLVETERLNTTKNTNIVVSARLPLHVPGAPHLLSPDFLHGLRELGSRGVLWEFCVYGAAGVRKAVEVCRLVPDTKFVLQHCAYIGDSYAISSSSCSSASDIDTHQREERTYFENRHMEGTPVGSGNKNKQDQDHAVDASNPDEKEDADEFRSVWRPLQRCANLVAVKISGLEEWRTPEESPHLQWIDAIIRLFGYDRVMVGSNFFLCDLVPENLFNLQHPRPTTRSNNIKIETNYAFCFDHVSLSLARLEADPEARDKVFYKNALRIYFQKQDNNNYTKEHSAFISQRTQERRDPDGEHRK